MMVIPSERNNTPAIRTKEGEGDPSNSLLGLALKCNIVGRVAVVSTKLLPANLLFDPHGGAMYTRLINLGKRIMINRGFMVT